MNIILKLKELLSNNKSLININDMINIPSREYYLDSDYIDIIDKYIEQYNSILKSKDYLVKLKSNYDEFQKKFNMYITLILNTMLNMDDLDSNEHIESYRNKVSILKLKLYLDEFLKLELENTLRLISINEIKSKRLNEEKNRLISNYIIFNSHRNAFKNELDRYLIKSLDNDIDEFEVERDSKKITDYASNILDNNEIIKNDLYNIIITEMKLEEYVYIHKNIVHELEEELNKISLEKINGNNKNILFSKVKYIENKLELFDKYGRGLVSNELKELLYKTKFNILIYNINSDSKNITTESIEERNYYEKVIMNKVNDLVTGKKINDPNLIKIISKYLKNNDIYDSYDILFDNYKLKLLFSLNDLDSYFNKFMVNTSDVSCFSSSDGLSFRGLSSYSWNDLIPIKSVCQLIDDGLETNLYFNKIYNIYDYYYKKEDKFYIPEGINSINNNIVITSKFYDNSVVFPHTLEHIHLLNPYVTLNVKDIECNSELKTLNLFNININKLSLYNNINNIYLSSCNINTLILNDFDIEKDKELIKNIISQLFYKESSDMKVSSIDMYDNIDAYGYVIHRPLKKVNICTNLDEIIINDDIIYLSNFSIEKLCNRTNSDISYNADDYLVLSKELDDNEIEIVYNTLFEKKKVKRK